MHSSTRSRIVAHLRAQWAGLLALFLVIAGGTAYAANTIGSSDIIDGQVRTLDISNSNGVRSVDVRDDTQPDGGLTGADIQDQSGVDTCLFSLRIGQLCFRAENFQRPWDQALAHCGNLDMRAPSLGEALELVQTHDLPNVDENEFFWTEETVIVPGGAGGFYSYGVTDSGANGTALQSQTLETVCVSTPTN